MKMFIFAETLVSKDSDQDIFIGIGLDRNAYISLDGFENPSPWKKIADGPFHDLAYLAPQIGQNWNFNFAALKNQSVWNYTVSINAKTYNPTVVEEVKMAANSNFCIRKIYAHLEDEDIGKRHALKKKVRINSH